MSDPAEPLAIDPTEECERLSSELLDAEGQLVELVAGLAEAFLALAPLAAQPVHAHAPAVEVLAPARGEDGQVDAIALRVADVRRARRAVACLRRVRGVPREALALAGLRPDDGDRLADADLALYDEAVRDGHGGRDE